MCGFVSLHLLQVSLHFFDPCNTVIVCALMCVWPRWWPHQHVVQSPRPTKMRFCFSRKQSRKQVVSECASVFCMREKEGLFWMAIQSTVGLGGVSRQNRVSPSADPEAPVSWDDTDKHKHWTVCFTVLNLLYYCLSKVHVGWYLEMGTNIFSKYRHFLSLGHFPLNIK